MSEENGGTNLLVDELERGNQLDTKRGIMFIFQTKN